MVRRAEAYFPRTWRTSHVAFPYKTTHSSKTIAWRGLLLLVFSSECRLSRVLWSMGTPISTWLGLDTGRNALKRLCMTRGRLALFRILFSFHFHTSCQVGLGVMKPLNFACNIQEMFRDTRRLAASTTQARHRCDPCASDWHAIDESLCHWKQWLGSK